MSSFNMGWDGMAMVAQGGATVVLVCRNFGVKIFKTDEMGQKKRKSVNLQLKRPTEQSRDFKLNHQKFLTKI
jgi:hypothetical protein